MITDRMLAAEVMILKRFRSGWRQRHRLDEFARGFESMKLGGYVQALRAIRESRTARERKNRHG